MSAGIFGPRVLPDCKSHSRDAEIEEKGEKLPEKNTFTKQQLIKWLQMDTCHLKIN